MKNVNNGEINLQNSGQTLTLFGFVANKRKMGKLTFIDLRDRTGIIQLVLDKEYESFNKESVIKVSGIVRERSQKNLALPTGEIEIEVTNLEVLSYAYHELPFVIRDDLEAKEETRLKHRYLDLRRPKMQAIIKTRHIIVKAIRDFLVAYGFYEIETPILANPTPEGARDFLVKTRFKDHYFALPQSPQIYKQLLMIAGFEKYFQIARVFRDEDARKDRQPEFTQLDLEMAYGNEEDIKVLMEKLYQNVFAKIGIKITVPFRRMDYDQALQNYGNDKPDTRYNYLLNDVTAFLKNSNFSVFKSQPVIKMIAFDQLLSTQHIKILEQEAKKSGARGLVTISNNEGILKGLAAKFLASEAKQLFADYKIKSGTLFFVAGQAKIVNKALGAVRTKLNELFNLARDEYHFLWIENWPLFELDPQTNAFVSTSHPFARPTLDTIKTFDQDKINAKARSYDLVLNGFELGSGSLRNNDPEIQSRIFSVLGLSKQKQASLFGFLLEAMRYGVPPHLGIALGIDRLIMIIHKTKSIRDVIAFPKNAAQIAIMEKSPSIIEEDD